MPRELVKGPLEQLPPGLETLFNDPPLAVGEKQEDYETLFSAIVAAIKPRDAVVFLLARDFTDLTWEIRRERKIRLQVIRSAQADVVSELLSPPDPVLLGFTLPTSEPRKTDKIAKQWAADGAVRQRVDKRLAKDGYDSSYILTDALKRAAPQIEAIDRRIASSEMRRMMALKGIEQYSEASARRLADSTDVIDGEFTEAAE